MRYTSLMMVPDSDTFALSGLISRAGLSNWVFFFCGDELVMIDFGAMPSILAGLEAGICHHVGSHGPQRGAAHADDGAWLEDLATSAKHLARVPYPSIASIRVHLRLMANELILETTTRQTFTLMNRVETDRAIDALSARLGSKLVVSKSRAYAWLESKAAFLVGR